MWKVNCSLRFSRKASSWLLGNQKFSFIAFSRIRVRVNELSLFWIRLDRACSKLAQTAWDGVSCCRMPCSSSSSHQSPGGPSMQPGTQDTAATWDLQAVANTFAPALLANYSCCRTYTHAAVTAVSWGSCMGHITSRLMLHDADGIISTLARG